MIWHGICAVQNPIDQRCKFAQAIRTMKVSARRAARNQTQGKVHLKIPFHLEKDVNFTS